MDTEAHYPAQQMMTVNKVGESIQARETENQQPRATEPTAEEQAISRLTA